MVGGGEGDLIGGVKRMEERIDKSLDMVEGEMY